MKRLTITCSDELAKAIGTLILDQRDVDFHAETFVPEEKKRGKQKSHRSQDPATSRGLSLLLKLAISKGIETRFTVNDLAEYLPAHGLAASSASPYISHARTSDIVQSVGKGEFILTSKGIGIARKAGYLGEPAR